MLLGVTGLAFVWVGVPGVSSWTRMAMLVPVLLFHELGHYLAMRVFGYRNLRMFFIPGFGAAVTGRSFNVAGWKKVVVALMGPLPGILVGTVVGLVGVVWHAKWAEQLGLMMVSLNGFNLVPVLPFDGGQVAYETLFSRHRVLDVAFRGLAVVGLLALAFALKLKYTYLVAIPIIVSLPAVWRQATVARELQKEGVRAESADGQTIPLAVVDRIVEKLRAAQTKPVLPAVLAQQTLGVFESINRRPPGVLASLGLLAVHGVGLALAVVMALAIKYGPSMAQPGAGPTPRYSLTLPEVRERAVQGDVPSIEADLDPTVTVIATWTKSADSARAWDGVRSGLAEGESGARVGSSVFVRIASGDDAARAKWVQSLEGQGAQVVVDRPGLRAVCRVWTVAPSPDEATRVVGMVSDYLELMVEAGVVAPWTDGPPATESELLARRTLRALQDNRAWGSAPVREKSQQITDASRQGDKARVSELQRERDELVRSQVRAHVARIVDAAPGTYDHDLAVAYREEMEHEGWEYVRREWLYSAVTPRLGKARQEDRTWALGGYADGSELIVRLSYVRFRDPASGFAAMCDWLNKQKCVALRYEFEAGRLDDSDEE